MGQRALERRGVLAGACLAYAAAAALLLASPALALAPHIAEELDTDSCALCHRSHSAARGVEYESQFSTDTVGDALIVGPPTDDGDVQLCYVCHGVDAVGAESDVQSSFILTSTHVLLPDVSLYGSPEKQCSTCHDSHGSDKTDGGDPVPKLLRVYDTQHDRVYGGEAFCAACHLPRAEESFDGLDVFEQTVHFSEVATPATGTGIRCLNCHVSHGSYFAPLITDEVLPPAAAATSTVSGNDRTLCFACHTASTATYGGKIAYDVSSHATSSASVTVTAAWASEETTRLVGECQNCHASMGREKAGGGLTAKLLDVEGAELCYQCHGPDGPASADLESLVPTAGAVSALDLVVASTPASPTVREERLSLYSRESTGSPRPMMGPREYVPTSGVGPVAAGDVDGDGANEVVVADPDTAAFEVFEYDPLTGLTSAGTYSLGGIADLIEVADVVLDASGRPEIAVVDRNLGLLGVYRITDTGIVSVAGPTGVGNGASSLASGDVTGTAAVDLVVTAGDDDQFRVFTESGGGLTAGGPYSTRSGPRGASVGDAWLAGTKDEIVIVNSGETTGTVSVYRGDGLSLGDFDDGAATGSVAYDSVVADVLPGVTPSGTSGDEVAVVFRSADGTSGVEVFAQTTTGGLATPLTYTTGSLYNSGTIAAGDVDDDGRTELVIGSGGLWSRDSSATAPSAMVGRANALGTAIGAWETLWLGGSELAGEPPAVVLADLGGVLPSRHPIGAVADTHVSTETAPVARHVECVDCHDVHAANDATATAPAAYGVIEGTWGVTITPVSTTTITYTEQRGIAEEYQLCLKCHSGWADLDGGPNIAFEINPLNPGEHAVVETSTDVQATSGSFVSGWDTDSVLYCVDCHGNSRSTETTGPHVSPDGPLLKDPYLGRRPNASDLLCYGCHKDSVYYTGVDDGIAASTSRFYDGALALDRRKLHRFHSNSLDIGCAACHVGHGSRELPHLLRGDVGYSHAASGGSCANACHVGGARNSYTYP